MRRGKTEMKFIENPASRHVTFSKRRNGLLKKAFELSVLCDAEIALFIFSPKGQLHEFASSSVEKIIKRYQSHVEANISSRMEQNLQHQTIEAENLVRKIEHLKSSKRKFMGEELESCSNITEVQAVEWQLEQSARSIRARKMQLCFEQIEQLKEKENKLAAENHEFFRKLQHGATPDDQLGSDVQTELFIGPPGIRRDHNSLLF